MLHDLEIHCRSPHELRPYPRNARTHSKRQVRQIAESIRSFGFLNPVLIERDGMIVAGHGRVEAAKLLGMAQVPTILLSHLTKEQRTAYVLADNRLADLAGYDTDILAAELQAVIAADFDLDVVGFTTAEADIVIDDAAARSSDAKRDKADRVVEPPDQPVTKPGDLWQLGRHRVICGDARDPTAFDRLLEGRVADLIFTDPPYNVRIDGNACGLGSIRHREFAMASGEMSPEEFTTFLTLTLLLAAGSARDGAIAYVCMDWRHARELLQAGSVVFPELKQLCVWNKTNGGMGTFYRSKHELVFVFKVGDRPHINNFGLGDGGRYRTNVWDYPGISSISSTRMADLALHPTTKPVTLVADAIKDCSKRGDLVLDCFGGSGTTLIAAEQCGRRAALIEFDPAYCDTIVQRFQRISGKRARHVETGRYFEDVALQRVPVLTGGQQ